MHEFILLWDKEKNVVGIMAKCDYIQKGDAGDTIFSCDEGAVSGSNFCVFHNEAYGKAHPDEQRIRFSQKFKDAHDQGKPLVAMGYQIFCVIEFGNYNIVSADFEGSTFHEKMLFNIIFRESVSFKKCIFKKKVDLSKQNYNKLSFEKSKVESSIDLTDAQIHTLNCVKVNANKIFCNSSKITQAKLEYSQISEVFLINSSIDHLNLSGADVKVGHFLSANINDAFFENAKLGAMYFSGGKLRTFIINSAIFGGKTQFDDVEFQHFASFNKTTFKEGVHFDRAQIMRVNFIDVTFNKDVSFIGANMVQVFFKNTIFYDNVDFNRSEFEGRIEFVEVDFSGQKTDAVKNYINFSLTIFPSGDRVLFDHTTLKNVIFLKAENLDKVRFLNVEWTNEGGRYRLAEEDALEGNELARKITGKITRNDVLSIYRKLKDNYERESRYDEAGKFFMSEMDLQRKYDEAGNKRNWALKHLSPRGAYYHIAKYGESYSLPLGWCIVIIVAFTAFRLDFDNPSSIITEGANRTIDSIAAFFQVPRGNDWTDVFERLLSIPILGSFVIALRRKLERKFRK